jgi:hypothetical protein
MVVTGAEQSVSCRVGRRRFSLHMPSGLVPLARKLQAFAR